MLFLNKKMMFLCREGNIDPSESKFSNKIPNIWFSHYLQIPSNLFRGLSMVQIIVSDVVHHITQQATSKQSRGSGRSRYKFNQVPELVAAIHDKRKNSSNKTVITLFGRTRVYKVHFQTYTKIQATHQDYSDFKTRPIQLSSCSPFTLV